MAFIQKFSSGTVTTNGSGAATVYFGPNGNADPIQHGYIVRVAYTKVDFSNSVTFTFTGENSGASILAVTAGNGDASTVYSPYAISHVSTSGAATGNTDALIPIVGERIKLVIAAGGATKTGSFVVYVG